MTLICIFLLSKDVEVFFCVSWLSVSFFEVSFQIHLTILKTSLFSFKFEKVFILSVVYCTCIGFNAHYSPLR